MELATALALPRAKPTAEAHLDLVIKSAIAALERERKAGYPEATHRMIFPRAAGFSGESDEQAGCVFQRALIAEALLESAAAGFHIDWNGIDEDVEELVALRCTDVAGGWRYFPGLPELPPDADDLAIILRLLVRVGHPHVAALCDPPLRLLLEQERPLPTWIVDDEDTSLAMRRAIETQWGAGADVEVVANILHAMASYDEPRFRDELKQGLDYVVGQQDPSGTWRSTWYHGELYGTFACARLLAATAPDHYALRRVGSALTSSQRADGGWGSPASTPTDTALAMLSLALSAGTASASCDRGVAYLIARQDPDGRWPADPFIKMDTNRVQTLAGTGQPRIVSFKSSTVTTALCLQALCATRKLAAV